MTRIILPTTTLVGHKLLEIVGAVVDISERINRLKNIVDQITTNGSDLASLENSAESKVPAGVGPNIYAGINQIQTAINGLIALTSAIDQG